MTPLLNRKRLKNNFMILKLVNYVISDIIDQPNSNDLFSRFRIKITKPDTFEFGQGFIHYSVS